jgi:hypothetical protein
MVRSFANEPRFSADAAVAKRVAADRPKRPDYFRENPAVAGNSPIRRGLK